jgi:AcrR family transcriptional regulator
VTSNQSSEQRPGGRQSAYVARNRAALVEAAQEVLSMVGPSATIEQLADHAGVSPTTIYKYFESKEMLFAEALKQIWTDWVVWSNLPEAPGTSLEATLDSGRKLFWVADTHPLLARILQKTLHNPAFLIGAVKESGVTAFRNYANNGALEQKDFDQRMIVWTFGFVGLLEAVFVTNELSPKEAESALGIALSVWGLSQSRIDELLARPIDIRPPHG